MQTSTPSPYGSPGARLGGYFLDSILLSFVQFGGSFLGGIVAAMMIDSEAPKSVAEDATAAGMLLGLVFWGCVAWFLNYGVLQGLTGGSFGKMAVGLRVLNRDGSPIGILKSISRSLCYLVSAIPLYLGFVALLWSDQAQCWHDTILGTVVVRKNAQYPVTQAAVPSPSAEERPAFPNAA